MAELSAPAPPFCGCIWRSRKNNVNQEQDRECRAPAAVSRSPGRGASGPSARDTRHLEGNAKGLDTVFVILEIRLEIVHPKDASGHLRPSPAQPWQGVCDHGRRRPQSTCYPEQPRVSPRLGDSCARDPAGVALPDSGLPCACPCPPLCELCGILAPCLRFPC